MIEESAQHEPAGRHWIAFWSVVAMQIIAAFNMNLSKVVLVALGLWLAKQGQSFQGIEHIVAVALVLPYVLFSPTAGWLADRFPNSTVIRASAIGQVLLLIVLWLCLRSHALGAAVAVFFLLACQATLLSPSKMSIIKELVGGRRMGFACGVLEGTVILAILGGQIAGGNWFDAGLLSSPGDGWRAGIGPTLWLVVFGVVGTLVTLAVLRTPAHSSEDFSWQVATRHIRDLREIFRDNLLRRCGIGAGFFWGFGGFLYLVVLQIAQEGHGGGDQGTGTAFARLWAMAVVGIAAGSISAGLVSRKRIELGLSPLGGIMMTTATIALAFTRPESTAMMVMLALTGAGAAVFLVPQQAVIQDRPAPDKRGAVLSASNLINNMVGVAAVALQFVFKKLLFIPVIWQLVIIGVLALVFTVITLRAHPADFVRIICLAILKALYRIRPVGLSNIPTEGGVLLLPNHLSFADAFFLSAACPRPVRFVMDEEFTRNPWINRFAKLYGTVAISAKNTRQAVRTVTSALRDGDVLCVFPEGQLSRTGTPCKIQRGFTLIAQQARCPVIPVWIDGAWGSVFSFEGGCFFHKRPRAFPLRLTISFGPPLATIEIDPTSLRSSLYQASAAAISERFRAPRWNPLPARCAKRKVLELGSGKHLWINGYQIGQINAIPWRASFAVFASDEPFHIFPTLAFAFPELFHSKSIEMTDTLSPGIRYWVGGEFLREAFTASPPPSECVFFDFSPDAISPLEIGNVIHCPCLASGGIVIAMSLPTPPLPFPSSLFQPGCKAGSHGLLLPGFTYSVGQDGALQIGGLALPPHGIILPSGSHIDEEGFLFLAKTSYPSPGHL